MSGVEILKLSLLVNGLRCFAGARDGRGGEGFVEAYGEQCGGGRSTGPSAGGGEAVRAGRSETECRMREFDRLR